MAGARDAAPTLRSHLTRAGRPPFKGWRHKMTTNHTTLTIRRLNDERRRRGQAPGGARLGAAARRPDARRRGRGPAARRRVGRHRRRWSPIPSAAPQSFATCSSCAPASSATARSERTAGAAAVASRPARGALAGSPPGAGGKLLTLYLTRVLDAQIPLHTPGRGRDPKGSRPRRAQCCSSGAIVSPADLSCSQ